MYEYKKMLSDMRQDLTKYVGLYPVHSKSNKQPNILRVLLTSPGYYVIASYRMLYWLKTWQETSGNHIVNIVFITLNGIFSKCSKITMKSAITNWPEIGPGLYFSNKGGIIIGPKRIGSCCVIHHNVTIGMNQDQDHPEIGDNVWIGPNSLIYGRIIKDGVIILAGSVVGKSVPACVAVKGNPARIVCRNIDNSSFLSNNEPIIKDE